MQGLKLNHVSKRGPRDTLFIFLDTKNEYYTSKLSSLNEIVSLEEIEIERKWVLTCFDCQNSILLISHIYKRNLV